MAACWRHFAKTIFTGFFEFVDVTTSNQLIYNYWYDANGGSNFSSLCPGISSSSSPQYSSSSDITAPTLINIFPVWYSSSSLVREKITWTTDEPADGTIEYGLTASYGNTAASSTLETSHAISLLNLLPSTTYHYRVISKDAAGNTKTSSDHTFFTAAFSSSPSSSQSSSQYDTTAPTISNIQATNIATNSATISWITNEAASSNVFYSTDASVMISPTRVHKTGATNATSFSISLSGLNQNSFYYYLVSSSDMSGNTATSTQDLFYTLIAGLSTQCNDAIDNDNDGKVDMNDLDCLSPSDNDESSAVTATSTSAFIASSSLASLLQSIAAALDDIEREVQRLLTR